MAIMAPSLLPAFAQGCVHPVQQTKVPTGRPGGSSSSYAQVVLGLVGKQPRKEVALTSASGTGAIIAIISKDLLIGQKVYKDDLT